MDMEEIARWAYIIFLAIAVVAGLAVGFMAFDVHPLGFLDPGVADTNGWVTLIMLALGAIIGITGSITTKEITPFLIATIALMVAGLGVGAWAPLQHMEALRVLYYMATAITNYIVAFATPAAVIIAIRSVLAITKEQ